MVQAFFNKKWMETWTMKHYAAIQTSDSGYLIAGSTNSNDGDISFQSRQ